MKVIHSFWSKPSLRKGTEKDEDRKSGGWIHRKYAYMSWALSCLSFKKQYGTIELITDSPGVELLIEKLALPYDNVVNQLDLLSNYDTDLWAVSKLFSYQLQNTPFIHVDSDVFIWEPLTALKNLPLVIQNEERDFDFNKKLWDMVQTHFEYIPEYMQQDYVDQGEVVSCNAGVFGGTDVEFIKEFAAESLEFLSRNQHHLHKIKPVGALVLIYEQYLFACLARSRKKNVESLLIQGPSDYKELSNFFGVPQKKKYVHALGAMKKQHRICEHLADRLLMEYPEYYYRVEELVHDHII
jgi:hypothetical protein